MHLDERVGLDGALRGFAVSSSDGYDLGEVSGASADHTFLFVASQRKLLGRSRRYAIHRVTIEGLDLDTMRLTTRATRAQVEAAPDVEVDLPESSLDLERYYTDLG